MSVNDECARIISVATIVKRNIDTAGKSDDNIVEDLFKLTHVRLDREGIKTLDNLESLGSVTNLYLQKNYITTIENLSCLASSLRFLTLAGNKISLVNGLLSLQFLKFLDLSDNLIKDLDVNELPVALVFVSFANNECTSSPSYRDELMSRLPGLKSIDDHLIVSSDDDDSDDDASSTETDDDAVYEDSGLPTPSVDKSSKLQDICLDMLEHSTSRMDEVVDVHRVRLKEIERSQSVTQPEVQDTVDLAGIEQEIQSVLHTMIEAERDVIDKFDITDRPVMSSSTKSCLNQDVVSAPCTPRIDAMTKGSGQNGVRPHGSSNKPTYSTVGTCTSRVPNSCLPEPLNKSRSSSRPHAMKNMPPTSPSSPPVKSIKEPSETRLRRKFLNSSRLPAASPKHAVHDSLVRIPGARPFHKP